MQLSNIALALTSVLGSKRKPALDLDFVTSETLDSRISFTRASIATRINSSGFIEAIGVDQPRFDYDPVTLAPKGLLIEEQRSNLLTYSSEFDNAVWAKSNATVTANAVVAPDGTTTADKLVESAIAGEHNVTKVITYVAGTPYTLSVYAKAGERNFVVLNFGAGAFGTTTRAYFNLAAGTVGTTANSPTTSIVSVGAGWYRCSITKTATVSAAANTVISETSTNGVLSYTGDGTSGIYTFGAQLEAGEFPTSYIPTTSASVTRAADNASMVGTNFSSWYNQSEGTFAVKYLSALSSGFVLSIMRTAGYGPRMQLSLNGANTSYLAVVDDASAVVCSVTSPGTKSAFAYMSNNFALSANGNAPSVDASGTQPTSIVQLKIGQSPIGDILINGHIQSIKYYPTRLPNGDLIALSS